MPTKIRKLERSEFPAIFSEIPQAPKQLYIRGELPTGNLTYLCVVGSRNHTSYGRDVCEKLIAGLKGYPIVIVSGLARGIDSIAHKKALDVGLKVMSFPGSGLDETALYPHSNIKLAQDIEDAGGCLISESEPTMRAQLFSFPQRNRLMAGICKAVLVIEAEVKSGTLITARLATEYNRDVLAVPGSIFSDTSKGTNRLIRQGATPITCAEEVLDALGFKVEKDPDKQQKLFADCSPDERKVLDHLREPIERDELLRALKMPIPDATSLLSIMELKGLIREEYGEIRKDI